MSDLFGTFLWLSIAGSLLLLLMLGSQKIGQHKLPPTWFYYLWLIVVLRFLIPLPSPLDHAALGLPVLPSPAGLTALSGSATPPANATPVTPATAGFAAQSAAVAVPQPSENALTPADTSGSESSGGNPPAFKQITAANPAWPLLFSLFGVIWLLGLGILLVRDLRCYLVFKKLQRQTRQALSSAEIVTLYTQLGRQLNLKKMPRLYHCPAIRLPMQVGILHPSLLIPSGMLQLPEEDLRYYLLHELTHYRRQDVLYKWLVQLCVWLHWFNPLVYLMRRQLNALCELSCDAAVLRLLQPQERIQYGNMLLKAMQNALDSSLPLFYGAAWGNNVKDLKVRFEQIMNTKKTKKPLLALLMMFALFLGACASITGPASGNTATEDVGEPADIASSTGPNLTDEQAIQWQEPALEALVREWLGKPSGDIYAADLASIRSIELYGDSHLFVNGEDGYNISVTGLNVVEGKPAHLLFAKDDFDSLYAVDENGRPIKDGRYRLGGVSYERGSLTSLADFAHFSNLESLWLMKNNLQDLSGLGDLAQLKDVYLRDNNIRDLSSLGALKQAANLALNLQANEIEDISALCASPALKELNLAANNVVDLQPLAELTNLQSLCLQFNPVADFSPLGGLSKLNLLNATGFTDEDTAVLAQLTNLRTLTVGGSQIENISFLANLPKLEVLGLEQTPVQDLSPLLSLANLKYLDISNLTALAEIDVAAVVRALPDLRLLAIRQEQCQLLNVRALAELQQSSLYSTGLQTLDLFSDYLPHNVAAEDITWLREQMPSVSGII